MTARERFSVFELFLSAISKAHPRSTLSELGSETCISHGETLSHIIDERHAPLAVRLLRSVMCAINRSSEKAMGACAVCGYEKASLLYHRDADSQTCIECFWNHIGPEIQKGGVCGGPFAWLKQWSLFRKRVFEASLHSTCPGCATYDDSGALLCVKETGKCALDIHHIEGDNAVQPRSAVDTQALIDLAGSISGLSSHIVQPAGQADASYDTSAEDHAPLPQEHQQRTTLFLSCYSMGFFSY